ncbi:MAG TPA: hypothetical protein DCE14_05965 [Kosmotogaceae bacterium]|nr:MAG: Uncharacterized protein XE05_1468 [Thermotogales bacterium 46_20]HAA85875.1 hypothetical protein [Kosmotogaceae bacterium]
MRRLYFFLLITALVIVLLGCTELFDKPLPDPVIPGEMVYVKGGTFMMGDEFGDLNTWSKSSPVHQVTLTYDFWMGKYPVTFDEYDAFCDDTGRTKPSDAAWGRGTRPVMRVSWWDAIAYCNWLSEKEGLPVAYILYWEPSQGQMLDADGNITTDITEVVGCRLPTEAEWEYAARGGKHQSPYRYSGSDNIGDVAWYWRNSGDEYLTGEWDLNLIAANNCRTHPVGTKLPNALGIYDMSGNIWELCSDWYDRDYYSKSPGINPFNYTPGSFRVVRGGSWLYDATFARVANRSVTGTALPTSDRGFRIARTVH